MAKQKKKKIPRDLRMLKNVIQPKAEEVKKSVCSFSYFVTLVKTLCLIVFYYFFSITLTFYNQHFIHEYKLPLSFTMAHLVFKFMAAGLLRWVLECRSGEPRVLLGWKDYCKRVAPVGIVSSLDIGLSNWSFDFITVSLYTMSKSSAVIFILGFALLFRLEKCRLFQVFVVIFIAVGLFMFTFQSTQFNLEGFIMVMSASALSGLRWTLAQMVLQKNEIGLHNPLDMMYHVQPWMIMTLLPLAAGAEGMALSSTELVFRFAEIAVLAKNMGLVLLGAVLAFFLEFSEFLLVCNTSSLSLSIAGIFKELCILYLAFYVNGDRINFVNGIGLVVCLVGIALHVIIKAVYARYDREQEMVHALNHPEERIEMLTRNGNPNTHEEEEEEDDDEEDIFNVDRDR
ncbi:solute carrier family 35 member C2-like [Littorina saxatilis]|uniref:Sugar phosphate transporter domain-containing protein n=1 Tax=Littorina saxatilis TaxID=31220 RepID=A0AAN9GML4_9CAEN